MSSIVKQKSEALQDILNAYVTYNGMPKNEDFQSVSDFIIFAFANSRKVRIRFKEDIDKKFAKLEDLE